MQLASSISWHYRVIPAHRSVSHSAGVADWSILGPRSRILAHVLGCGSRHNTWGLALHSSLRWIDLTGRASRVNVARFHYEAWRIIWRVVVYRWTDTAAGTDHGPSRSRCLACGLAVINHCAIETVFYAAQSEPVLIMKGTEREREGGVGRIHLYWHIGHLQVEGCHTHSRIVQVTNTSVYLDTGPYVFFQLPSLSPLSLSLSGRTMRKVKVSQSVHNQANDWVGFTERLLYHVAPFHRRQAEM